MPDIHFYHLLHTPLENALAKLLERAQSGGFSRILVHGSEQQCGWLDEALWKIVPNSFLAHSTAADEKYAVQQPILLTHTQENLNAATLLIIINGAKFEDVSGYTRVCDMFDGRDDEQAAAARTRWSAYKEADFTLVYNKQNEAGGWN